MKSKSLDQIILLVSYKSANIPIPFVVWKINIKKEEIK